VKVSLLEPRAREQTSFVRRGRRKLTHVYRGCLGETLPKVPECGMCDKDRAQAVARVATRAMTKSGRNKKVECSHTCGSKAVAGMPRGPGSDMHLVP
jgi:hypothetical protein